MRFSPSIAAWKFSKGHPELTAQCKNRVTEAIKARKEKAARVLDTLYPNRPLQNILPSSAEISKLAGTYAHPGYGTFTFTAANHPDKAGVQVLEARRPDCFFAYKMQLEHVSGDYWAARVTWLHTSTADRCDAAKFRFGVDGTPMGMELILRNEGADEGTIVLAREKE